MKNALIDAIDQFATAGNADARWRVATDVAAKLGFHNILVAQLNGPNADVAWVNTNMPDSWMEEYLTEGYVEVDPLVHQLTNRNASIMLNSGQLHADEAATRRHYALNHGMLAAGLTSLHCTRFSPPNGISTSVTLVSDAEMDKTFARTPVDMKVLSSLLAISITQPITSRSNEILLGKAFSLTPRQKDVLSLLASGHQTSGIAYKLGITEAAVNKHFIAAKTKLDASTREHALAIAMQAGVIEL